MSKRIPVMSTSKLYKPIADRLLLVDELEKGELPSYQREITVKAFTIGKRAQIPTMSIETETTFVPTIEIGTNAALKLHEDRGACYYIKNRIAVRSRDAILRRVDHEALGVISAAAPVDHTISVSGCLQPENLLLAISLVETHELSIAHIVMHPVRFKDMLGWSIGDFCDIFAPLPRSEREKGVLKGYFDGIPVITSTMCAKDTVIVIAPAEYVGVMPIKQKLKDIDAATADKLRTEDILFTELGFAVLNDYAISKVICA